MSFLPVILHIAAQLAAILAVTGLCGVLAHKLRQPRVMGEIVGGLLLGPLLLGRVAPGFANRLFAPGSMHAVEVLSNAGLVLFLFYIGSELDFRLIAERRRACLLIALGSISVPFAGGMALAPMLARKFPAAHTSGTGFALFAGVLFSITAFPVLARILEGRKQTQSDIERDVAPITLLAAAVNDLLGWSLMAVALAVMSSDPAQSATEGVLRNLLLLAAYLACMLGVVRPGLGWMRGRWPDISLWLWIPTLLVFAIVSANVTDRLGVHAFFGAFLAGFCVPRDADGEPRLERSLGRLLRPFTGVTLPLFFAITGLRLQAGMFSARHLGLLGIILVVAVSGKIGGTLLAGRAAGLAWGPATHIGILMNTRGLVELIALNVGYRRGVLNSELFTLLVLMAVITTAATVPLLDIVGSLEKQKTANLTS